MTETMTLPVDGRDQAARRPGGRGDETRSGLTRVRLVDGKVADWIQHVRVWWMMQVWMGYDRLSAPGVPHKLRSDGFCLLD
jgi:hypothetical protein